MHSSTLVVLALAAAAAAAPIEVRQKGGASGALANVANGAGLASAALNIGNFVGGLFGGDEAQAREFVDIMTRELDARQKGAAALGNAANAAGLASAALNIGNFVGGLFGGDEAQAREFTELMSRELDARQKGAAALGNAANAAGLASAAINIGNAVSGLFQRELDARQKGGAALGNAANAAGLASSALNIGNFVSGLFGGDEAQAREFTELMTRELDARQKGGAANLLSNAATGAGVISGAINAGNFVSDLFSRELDARQKGAAALGNAANAAGLASAAINIGNAIGGLFQRELDAREIEALESLVARSQIAQLD